MRIIANEKKNKEIHSPWYRPEDAAVYCGLSRSEFDKRAVSVPHAGDRRLRLYHQNILDRWLTGDLGIAFDPDVQPAPIRIRRGVRGKRTIVRNPITGEVLSS